MVNTRFIQLWIEVFLELYDEDSYTFDIQYILHTGVYSLNKVWFQKLSVSLNIG